MSLIFEQVIVIFFLPPDWVPQVQVAMEALEFQLVGFGRLMGLGGISSGLWIQPWITRRKMIRPDGPMFVR